jgi:regulator of sigma E protease
MVSYPKLSRADEEAVIGDVLPDSPAAKAGIQAGDRIVKLDTEPDPTWEDVKLKEAVSAYRPIAVTVERGGRRFATDVTPTLSERSGVGSAGWDKRGEVELYTVDLEMPAGKAGLKIGDVVTAVNGQTIDSVNKLHNITETSGGQPLQIEYLRDGRKMAARITPVFDKKDGPARWMIGVSPGLKPHYLDTRLSLPAALDESLSENAKGASMIGKFLEGMVQRRMSPKNLTGPIGMIELSGDAAREGPSAYLGLMSMVSLNLAIFNLLPIPILDGGLILLLLVEMVMHRDLSITVKEAVFKVGFVFIMIVVAFVLYNDISRYLPSG